MKGLSGSLVLFSGQRFNGQQLALALLRQSHNHWVVFRSQSRSWRAKRVSSASGSRTYPRTVPYDDAPAVA